VELDVRAKANPTEDENKLLKALENTFPSLDFRKKGGFLAAKSCDKSDLSVLKAHIKNQQIRETARSFMLHNIDGDKLRFNLNKQAAFMGSVNFVDFEIALGAIIVTIQDEDLEGLVEWLCE
jgi:uncharacterized protein